MSQVESVGRGVLCIAIGARRVEWGLLVGKRWVDAAGGELRMEPFDDAGMAGRTHAGTHLGVLAGTLQRLEAALGPWWGAGTGNAQPGRRQIRVLIADSWLSVGGLPWSAALQQPASADGFARAQLTAAGFTVEADDVIRLDDVPFGRPLLAVAYPALLLAALTTLAQRLGAEVRSVLPFSVAAWSVCGDGRGNPGVLAVVDEGLMLVAQGVGRPAAVTVRTGAFGGRAERGEIDGALRSQWMRMRLRDPLLASIKKLRVLSLMPDWRAKDGDADDFVDVGMPRTPGADKVSPRLRLASRMPVSVLDAIPARDSTGKLAWLAAAAALMAASALSLQAWQTRAQAVERLAQLQVAQAPVRVSALPKAWSRDELARADAVNGAVRQLNLPISALLQALQPPRDIRAAVLAVEVAGVGTDGHSSAKIVAEARTGAEMARYVGYVSERRPFVGAYLKRHEVIEASPERPYRFTLEAMWRD